MSSVEERLRHAKERLYRAQAEEEINSGRQREDLMAKALLLANGDHENARTQYLKLLTQTMEDEAKTEPAPENNIDKAKKPPLSKAGKRWNWFLLILSIAILVVLLTMVMLGKIGITQKLIFPTCVWLYVLSTSAHRLFSPDTNV